MVVASETLSTRGDARVCSTWNIQSSAHRVRLRSARLDHAGESVETFHVEHRHPTTAGELCQSPSVKHGLTCN
jgi:hypothetical protein